MKSRTFGCLMAIVLLALVVSVFANLLLFSSAVGTQAVSMKSSAQKPKFQDVTEVEGKPGAEGKIVRIDLEGMITSMAPDSLFSVAVSSVDKIKSQLKQAVEDDAVKAILLRINSPGGEVTASDILYEAVRQAAEAKPVVVYMDAIAASGGYYIACGATEVLASETTLTGSIGVIIDTLNYTELFSKVGLASNTFVSGAFKDSLSGSRPMREEERAYVQDLVNQMYERFLTVVSEGRELPKDVLRNGVADGRVVTGADALKEGLVDGVGYIEDAYEKARELAEAPGVPVVRYRRQANFFELFSVASAEAVEGGSEAIQFELGQPWQSLLQPGLPYYVAPLSVPTR